jgi:TPR repeat protein
VRRQLALGVLGCLVGAAAALAPASAHVIVDSHRCIHPTVRTADGKCCPPGEDWFPSCSCCHSLAERAAACRSRHDPATCFAVGEVYAAIAPADPKRAADMFDASCKYGLIAGCLKMALSYETGQGRPRDPARAQAIYQKVCDAGVACACIVNGVRLTAPEHGERDARRGAAALARACEVGDRKGCRWLARLYHEGRGVERDENKAADLRARACAQKDREACDGVDPVRLRELPHFPIVVCRGERDVGTRRAAVHRNGS